MELQIFIEELTRRLPHMRLQAQSFSYLSNMSFRGPEHLWVEWDPTHNPERNDPSLLDKVHAVRIGESTRKLSSLSARVHAMHHETENIVCLQLKPLEGKTFPAWTAGAHIDVVCGTTGLVRQYSLCGDPSHPNQFMLAVLNEPHSRGGSQWVHHSINTGDMLQFRGPRNHFPLDKTAGQVAFVGAGIGITPLIPMALKAKQLGMDYVLHYSGKSRKDMAFVDSLLSIHGNRLVLHISDESSRANYELVLKDFSTEVQVYACGPQRLLTELETLCAGCQAARAGGEGRR
jgi:ferredoxin-NADP reductase